MTKTKSLALRKFRTLTGPARKVAVREHLFDSHGVKFGLDVHTLASSSMHALADMAKVCGYRKPVGGVTQPGHGLLSVSVAGRTVKAAPVHCNLAFVGIRILVQTLAMVYAVGGGGVLWLFSFDRQAASAFVVGVVVAWAVAPDKESRDVYIAFQRKRQGLPPE